MSKRDTILADLQTKLLVSSLGFSSVILEIRAVVIEDLDHTLFPLCHILSQDEILERFPNRLVTATLSPIIRCFFQSQTQQQCSDFITQMKIVLAAPGLAQANFFTLTSNRIITSPNHVYVEVAFGTQIQYMYQDTNP